MSVVSEGPRVRIAPGGRWFPPGSLVDAAPWSLPPESGRVDQVGLPVGGSPPVGDVYGGRAGRLRSGFWSHRPLALALSGTMLVVAVALALMVSGVFVPTDIPLGSGSAGISWHSTGSGDDSASFTGSAGGRSFQGTARPSAVLERYVGAGNQVRAPLPAELPFMVYAGTFAGTSFSITVSVRTADVEQALGGTSASDPNRLVTLHFLLAGRYGSTPISGTVTGTGSEASGVPPLHLNVSIGHVVVTGTILVGGSGSGSASSATVTFDATG